jgi:hypothetical protein
MRPLANRAFLVANKALVDRKNFGQIESGSPSGSNSAVECDLAKVEVAGSNPVSRSKVQAKAKLKQPARVAFAFRLTIKAA